MNGLLLTLAGIFGQLSLLAFGGGNAIVPEMQRQVVEVHHWMTATQFSALYGLAQAAPGPNLMIVTLIGWQIAGLPGALVTTFCQFAPSAVLTGIAVTAWTRFHAAPWRRVIAAGLQPITIGLVAASGALIARSADANVGLAAVTAAVALLTVTTRRHPLWLLGLGSFCGWLGGLLPW